MFCEMCGMPMMLVYSKQQGWAQACLKCGGRKELVSKPEFADPQAAQHANRGLNFYLTQNYEEAEENFLLAVDRKPESSEYRWAALLSRYGVRYCKVIKKRGRQTDYVINFWRNDLPEEMLWDSDEYKRVKNAAADLDHLLLAYYDQEAAAIDSVLMQTRESREEYDVFFSFKDTDEEHNSKTPEHQLLDMVYPRLMARGLKVFYAPISMEGRIVYDYAGYIHNAIDSAKMMVVVASSSKNINAPWVESEWKRFLLWNKEQKQRLIICTEGDMKVSALPPELRYYQVNLHAKQPDEDAAMHFAERLESSFKKLEKLQKPTHAAAPHQEAATDAPRQQKAKTPEQTEKKEPVRTEEKPSKEAVVEPAKTAAQKMTAKLADMPKKNAGAPMQRVGQTPAIPIPEGLLTSVLTYKQNADGTLTVTGCKDQNISKLAIPEKIDGKRVSSIGREAFQGFRRLKTASIAAAERIESRAFYGCTELQQVEFPAALREIGESAFAGCLNLTRADLPESVEVIHNEAFSRCAALTEVHLPQTMGTIGNLVFYGCQSLRKINVPAAAKWVGEYAFSGCESLPQSVLERFRAFRTAEKASQESPEKAAMVAKLVASLRSFGVNAEALTYVSNHDGTLTITGCKERNISRLVIPEKIDGKRVSTIGREAFQGFKSLRSVQIDAAVRIEDHAFCGCTELTYVKLPDSLREICAWAFASCSSLISMTLPDSVMIIGVEAFSRCTELTEVRLSESLIEIGNMAFFGCRSLEKINLPPKLAVVNKYVFSGCERLPKEILDAFNPDKKKKLPTAQELYLKGVDAWNRRTAEGYAQAARSFELAAQQGHVGAQTSLGDCYRLGKGVAQNDRTAVKWYRAAAEQGYAPAQFFLGCSYDFGHGVAQDCAIAVTWYRAAAEQGYAPAQFHLGCSYDFGHGVTQADEAAAKWYLAAARQEHTAAQFSIGRCYEEGIGVIRNPEEAVKWYAAAAKKGYKHAEAALKRMKGQ